MADQATLQIPQDVLKPIIEARVTEALAGALGPHSKVLEKVVAAVLSVRVNERGEKDTYGRSNSPTFLEWLLEDALKKCVRTVLEDEVMKHKEMIKAALTNEFKKKNSPIVKQLIESMAGAITGDSLKYRLNVTCEGR